MYEIESSTGYVLSLYNAGEADRRYKILTPERGVIIGTATSVRKEQSKLKHFLQRFNYVQFEYIHGKGGYRFTGGQLLGNTAHTLSRNALAVIARVFIVVERLTQGQDEDTNLFEIVQSSIEQLAKHSSTSLEEEREGGPVLRTADYFQAIENWATARVLVACGYYDVHEIPDIYPALYQQNTLTSDEVAVFVAHHKHLERYIRACVLQTML